MMAEFFVFGSNLAGRHGAGSARHALIHYGAIYGQGEGSQGLSYAIPTKDRLLNTLSLWQINKAVGRFIEYAKERPEHTYKVVAIGCGLAGYEPSHIGPMFKGAPDNVKLPKEFLPYV